jgi:hypothetical protein
VQGTQGVHVGHRKQHLWPPGGPSRTMMISEVLEWLHRPVQAELVRKENLEQLLNVALPSRI